MSFFERGRGRGGVRYRDKGNVNIVNAFPAEEERYHHFDVNRADSSVLRDRYGLHAGDGPNPTDWRFRHRGDRAKSKERDRSRSPFSDRPEQLGRVSPTYHESIRITVGNDQYCDAERPSKEDKLGLSVYDSDSTPPGSPGRRMPPKFLPRNLDSIDTRGPREFRQKDSYQAKVDNFIKECEEKLRSSGEKSFGSVAGSVYSSGEEKQLNRARQERFIRENWILEKAKEWQTEIEIEDKMKGKKSKEKDLAHLKDHEEKSEKSSKKKEKFLKSSRDLEDFISKERYGASHQGGEIFEKTFSYDKSRYLDEGFQSWKKCEHDSVPQTLSSPISFSLARPHSPDKLAKPRKSILKNKDIFSGVAGTVSSHEKLQKNSFVLPGLDLIDVDDEEKFLYGDDSGVTSAVSSGFEPPKKMLSSATDSKGDMWQSINNVLKDQTTLSHSSAECQLSTNEQKSMFEKAPMSSPLLSKHDPTIENILKSIGFDFEMSKRMQERAKQVQQPLKNLNQPQNSQFGINQSASFLSGGLVNVDIKPDFFKNKKKRMEGLENQHNGKKPKLHLEETEHLSKTEECESVQRGFSQPVSHSQAMQFSIPQIPSHSLLTLPPFTRVEHRSFPSPHFTQPGSRVFDQHCCFPVPVSHDSYYNFETDIPVSSAAKGGLVNSNLKVITLQEENPENEQLKDPVKCLSSSLSKGDPSGRKEVSPKLEEIKRTIEVKPISKPDHEKTILMQNEVDKLIKERYDRITKVESLTREVENLRKQQNNMMRKKQRQKDGHKDPVLIENAKLQDEISEQISKLKKMIEDNTSFLESAGIEVEPFPAPPAWSKKSHAHSISKKKGMAFPKPNQEFAPKEPVLLKKDQLPPRKDFPQSKAGGMSQKEKVPQKEERSAARKDWGPLSKEHPREQSRERSPSRKESLQPRKDWSKERSPLRSKWMQKQERPSLQKEQTKRRSPPRKDRSSPCREETPPQKEHSPPGEEHLIKQRSESSEAEQKSTNGNLPAKESKRTVSAGMKKIRFEYFDPGNHWCRLCNHISGNVFEVFQHLQSKKHQQKLDHYDRPWLPESIKNPSNKPKIGPVQLAPIKGVEFLMSTIAFYCSICHEFSGDVLSADAHLKSEVHNEKYQKYIEENPFYEKRYNLDKAAGLSMYPCDLKEKKRCEESDEEIQEDNKKKKKVRPVENTDAINDSKLEIEREIKIEIKSESLPDIKKEPKEMGEMGTENEEAKRASGFGRFTWSKGDEVVSDEEKVVEAPSVEQKPPEPAKTGKIAIKLTGKTGIKPVPRPVLSPWTAVSGKSTKTAPTPAKVEKFPLRKQTKREPEVPPSLDMFLSIEGKTSKKNIPVLMDIKDIPLPDKKKLTKQVIADAFSGKIKDDLPVSKTVDKGIAKPVSKERTVTTSMHSPPPPPPPLPSASVTKAAYMLRPPPPPPPPPLLSSLAEQKPETTPVLLLPDIKEQQEQANLEKNMVLCQIQPKAEVAGMENPVEGPQLPEKQSQLDSPIFEQSSELPLPKNNLKAEENVQPMQKESNDKSSMNSEDLEDMKMLGIDPTASIPIAIPKPPPPISCNASWQNSDCMATSSGSDLYSIFFKRQKQNLDGYELLNIASEDAIKNVRLIVDEIVDRTIEDLEETFLVKTEMQSSPDAANMSTESSENGTSEFESTSMQEEETKNEDVCSYAKSQAEASTSLDNSEQISSRVESRENCVSEQTGQEEINLVNAVTESFVTPVTDRWVDTGVSSVLTASSKDQENMPVQESEETNIITAVYESKTDGETRNFSSGEVAITPENSTEQEVSIVLVGCQDLLPSEYQKREIKIVSLADKVPTQITCSQWEDTNQQETLEAEEKETASALSSEKDGKVIDTTEFLNSEECQLMDCNTNTNSNFVMPILQNELKDSTLQEYATSDEIMPPDLSQEADAAASSDAGAEAMDASQPATDDDTPVQLSANFVSSSFDVVLEPSKFYVSSGEHELMMKSETEDFLLTPIVQVSEYSSCVTSSTVSITFTEPKLKATSLFLASAPEMFSEQPSTIDGSYLHISGPKAAMYTANLESPTQTLQINHPEKILLNQKTSVAGPTTDLENPFGKSSPNTLLRNEKNVESSSDVVLSSLSAHNLTGKSGSQESSVAEHLDADSGEIMLDKMASSTGFENLGSCNFPEFQLCLSKFPTADKDLHDKNAEALYGKAVTSASFENLNRSIQHCESGEHPPHVVSSKDQLETDSTLQPRQLSICNQIPNCGIERVSAPRITLEWEKRPSDKTDTETYVRINEMTIAHATELQTSALLDDKEAATTIHETEMLLCSLESPEPACLGSNCFRVSGIDTTLGIPSAEPSHSLPRECDEQSSCVKSKIYLLQQNTNDASSNEVSLLETTVKNVDAVPKMLMPCVILHDIRYTVSGSLSPEDSISLTNLDPLSTGETGISEENGSSSMIESLKDSLEANMHGEVIQIFPENVAQENNASIGVGSESIAVGTEGSFFKDVLAGPTCIGSILPVTAVVDDHEAMLQSQVCSDPSRNNSPESVQVCNEENLEGKNTSNSVSDNSFAAEIHPEVNELINMNEDLH